MTYDELLQWAEQAADESRARVNSRWTANLKTSRGAQHGRAKLTAGQVENIRLWRSEGATLAMVAARYDISVSTVSRICTGGRWKHV